MCNDSPKDNSSLSMATGKGRSMRRNPLNLWIEHKGTRPAKELLEKEVKPCGKQKEKGKPSSQFPIAKYPNYGKGKHAKALISQPGNGCKNCLYGRSVPCLQKSNAFEFPIFH